MPLALLRVEFGAGDDGLEGRVLAQVELLVDVVEVGLKLVPIWVVGRPVPVFVDFWNGELVNWYRRVDPITQKVLARFKNHAAASQSPVRDREQGWS